MKKKLVMIGLTIAAAVSLSACGSDSKSTETAVATEAVTTEVVTETITTGTVTEANTEDEVKITFPTSDDITNATTIGQAIKTTLSIEDFYDVTDAFVKNNTGEWEMIAYSTKTDPFVPTVIDFDGFIDEVNKNLGNKPVVISNGQEDLIVPDGWGIFIKNTDSKTNKFDIKVCAIKKLVDNKYSIMEIWSYIDNTKVPNILEEYTLVEKEEEVTEEVTTEQTTEKKTEKKKETKTEKKTEKKVEQTTEKQSNEGCIGDDALVYDDPAPESNNSQDSDEGCIGDDALVY